MAKRNRPLDILKDMTTNLVAMIYQGITIEEIFVFKFTALQD